MKLSEMADVLSGLASTFEPFLGARAVSDLREVSECFRAFEGENVKTFCSFVLKAKEGKTSGRKATSADQAAAVEELAAAVRRVADDPDAYDVLAIRELMRRVNQLKNPAIKSLGEKVGCPVAGTKGQMTQRLEDWLLNIKRSAQQSAFA